MKRFFLSIVLSLTCIAVIGQIRVQGMVTDSNNEPLIGVNVVVKNTTTGVSTNIDGKYEITVPNEKTELVFSYISYKTQSLVVGKQRTMNVLLAEDANAIDEVVVVGFGVVKKGDLTSSISSVKGSDVQKMTASNVTQNMQGQVAGMQVVGASGPGAQPKILIRGFSTVNLNTDPLYVVDGIPIGGDINYLSPNEIESIEILKDASASAIYGSRASNGVIMVTTKKGRVGKAVFSVDVNFGAQEMNSPYDMADAAEYAKIINVAAEHAGYPNEFENPAAYAGKTTNWWKAGVRHYTPQMNLSFGANGGTEAHQYAISLTYYNQDSFYEKGGFKRFTARIANDFKFAKWVSAGITLNPRFQSWGHPGNWRDFIRIDPITPIYKPAEQLTGEENEYSIYARSPSAVPNPVASVRRWKESNKSYALSSDAYLQIKPHKDLIFRSQLGVEVDSRISDSFKPDYIIYVPQEYQDYNSVSRSQPMYINWNLQNTLTYLHTFSQKHNVTLMVGNTLEEWNGSSFSGSIEKIPNNSELLQEIDAGTQNPQVFGNSYTTSIMSYLGRVMYNYDNRYYLTATYRVDGSSKFMKENKWAQFPSASVAWRVSGEKFMKPLENVINDLKLRLGWGCVGNQNLPADVYVSKLSQGYVVMNGNVVNTSFPSAVKNEDIKWETVEDINAGLDFSLLNGTVSGSLEYYVKKTKNMLFQKAYPSYSGYPNGAKIWTNIGSMRTKGYEMSLAYQNRFGDVTFGANATFTTFRVKMTELTGDKEPLYGNGEKTRTEKGEEPGFFYGYVADGLFQNKTELNSHTNDRGDFLQPYAELGDIRFKDVNGDGVLDASDRTKIGSPWADFTAGLNLNVGYKNFDLSASFYASVGNDLVNQNISELYNGVGKTNKVQGLADKAWQGEGTSNYIPRLSQTDNNQNFSRFSSFYIEDGSFLRMKNLQLGYTLPRKFGFEKIRVYVSAQNLFTITGYSGVDPEVAGGVLSFGFGGYDYPVQRTYLCGLNLTF